MSQLLFMCGRCDAALLIFISRLIHNSCMKIIPFPLPTVLPAAKPTKSFFGPCSLVVVRQNLAPVKL